MLKSNHVLLQILTRVAHDLADAARPETLTYFRTAGLGIDNKTSDGFDPVTEADRAAERAMRAVLAAQRPEDGILGEEFDAIKGSSGLTWVLDPIDGTRAYMSGTPTWGVLIAVGDKDGPAIGVIDQPYIGERFFGAPGEAWMEGPLGRVPLATRSTARLDQAILFSTYPEIGTVADREAFQSVAQHVMLTRYGMDCYAYGLLAAGQVDLVIEAGLAPYDIQGPLAVIEAAGGIVTNWQGDPAHHGGRVLAAANTVLHAAALDLLQDAP